MGEEDFRVQQTYGELGTLIREAIVDELTDDQDRTTAHLPVPTALLNWAVGIADRATADVLRQLDAAE